MTDSNPPTLLVELFLANGRVRGLTYEVHDRRRLVDVLIDGSPAIRLDSAKMLLGGETTGREFANLNVEKRAIFAAIPHETHAQQRERSMQTTTIGRSATKAIQATLVLPPFIAEGAVHVPESVGNLGSKLTADARVFARFFSVTGARLTLPGGAHVESPVLLVNRDLIAAISVLDERRSLL